MADSFDVIVIGAGPAGYPAAIRAGQNRLTVACVDEWKNHDGSFAFGGTCLNAGCIPSKALLESSELYHRAREEFAVHGIKIGGVTLDLATMQKRKSGIVKTMTDGIMALFKGDGVTPLQGHGRLLPGNQVEFKSHRGAERTLSAKHVVLASGSTPIELKSAPHDGKYIVDSWNALEVRRRAEAPRRHRRRRHRPGTRQRVAPPRQRGHGARGAGQFLPMVDQQLAKEAQRHFKKQGLDIRTGRQGDRRHGHGRRRRRDLHRCQGRAVRAGRQAGGRRRAPALHDGTAGGGHRRAAR